MESPQNPAAASDDNDIRDLESPSQNKLGLGCDRNMMESQQGRIQMFQGIREMKLKKTIKSDVVSKMATKADEID